MKFEIGSKIDGVIEKLPEIAIGHREIPYSAVVFVYSLALCVCSCTYPSLDDRIQHSASPLVAMTTLGVSLLATPLP